MLFFLIGLVFLCWNQYGLCTNMVKEDSNPKYGTDFDAEVCCVIVFIRSHPRSATNMIMNWQIIDYRQGTQILSMRALMRAREQEQVTTTLATLRSQPFLNNQFSIIFVKILSRQKIFHYWTGHWYKSRLRTILHLWHHVWGESGGGQPR